MLHEDTPKLGRLVARGRRRDRQRFSGHPPDRWLTVVQAEPSLSLAPNSPAQGGNCQVNMVPAPPDFAGPLTKAFALADVYQCD